MKVTEELTVDAGLPMKIITELQFKWNLNEHASLTIGGILDAEKADRFTHKDYRGTGITIKNAEKVLFCGIIKETVIQSEGGLHEAVIEAVSATIQLDRDRQNELFQDTAITYKQMMKQLTAGRSGSIISTVGDRPIGRPFLCFGETVWQYAKRIASQLHSSIVPDIQTGKPAYWFGLRKGSAIEEHGLACDQIEIQKPIRKGGLEQIYYQLSGREDYELCDKLFVDGEWLTICEKKGKLDRGEVWFTYIAANEAALRTEPYEQENITGLSLKGTVEHTENEQIYIRLGQDGKAGTYPFEWYPETGTGLYAMPERGARAEVYFMEADERTAVAIRCRDTKKTDNSEKKIELEDGAKIIINDGNIDLEKKSRLSLSDSSIELSGEDGIEISAAGKVKLSGKIVEVYSADTINYVTEW